MYVLSSKSVWSLIILPRVLVSWREYSPAFLIAPEIETELTFSPCEEFTITLSPFLSKKLEAVLGFKIVDCPDGKSLSTEILDRSAKGVAPKANLSNCSKDSLSIIS